MVLRNRYKKFNIFLCVAFSLILIMSIPFYTFASESQTSVYQSSSVPVSDFSVQFNDVSKGTPRLWKSAAGQSVTGSLLNSGQYWSFESGFTSVVTAFSVLDYTTTTLKSGYHYVISMESEGIYTNDSGGSNLPAPTFVLYSTKSDIYGLQFYSYEIEPSYVEEGLINRYIFEFDFDPENMFIQDSDTSGSDYSINGWGFKYTFDSSTDISTLKQYVYDRQCYVYSPEDWQSLKIVEGITKMDPETLDKIDQSIDDYNQAEDDLFNDINSLMPSDPDIDLDFSDQISSYVSSFVAVGDFLQYTYESVPWLKIVIDVGFSVCIVILLLKAV